MRRCSPAEFRRWKALYKLSPWGEERIDWQFAKLLAHLAIWCGKHKEARFEEYLLYREGEEQKRPRISLKDMKQAWAAFMAAATGKAKGKANGN